MASTVWERKRKPIKPPQIGLLIAAALELLMLIAMLDGLPKLSACVGVGLSFVYFYFFSACHVLLLHLIGD